jgi:hypothetical protein
MLLSLIDLHSITALSNCPIMKHLIYCLTLLLFFSPSVVTACPGQDLSGSQINHDEMQLYSGISYSLVAGGGTDLGDCEELPGFGYILNTPDFTLDFNYTKPGIMDLEFRVVSNCDSVLLVNDSAGQWLWDDDSNETSKLSPKIRIPAAQAGLYDLWIGSRFGEHCDARLEIETFWASAQL